jgi:hypothetical protein
MTRSPASPQALSAGDYDGGVRTLILGMHTLPPAEDRR